MDPGDLDPDPHVQFDRWFAEAAGAGIAAPEQMALATASADGTPSVRMVLLKGHDVRGFVFFTNRASRKGRELAENPRAAGVLHWEPQRRQVRIEGAVEGVGEEESSAYFRTRPRDSRLSAWASPQSRPLRDRADLERRVAEIESRFGAEDDIPCRRSGAATASSPRRSSSGRGSRAACTTACATSAAAAAGAGNGSRLVRHQLSAFEAVPAGASAAFV